MGLTAGDVADLTVSAGHRSALSGINYVYVQQRYNGVPVVDGIVTVAVNGQGQVVHAAGDLVPGIDSPATSSAAALSASAAVSAAAALVGAPKTPTTPVTVGSGAERFTTFGEVAGVLVTARYVYVVDGRSATLAWEVQVPADNAEHVWLVRLNAATGAELFRHDLVVSDHWGEPTPARTATAATMAPFVEAVPSPNLAAVSPEDGSSYLVYPIPYESPIHSPTVPPADGRELIEEPADAVASPFGWHDTDGADGAEFTITWGNNVRAYQDRNDDNTGTAADSPDCGADLDCVFDLDLTQAPSTYTDAAVTNLFYWNNITHDIKYQYGFDEAAGNFQVNNYGNGGLGNDDVRAEAQDGANTGKSNNANMFTPPDGQQPRMQMFEWTTATPRIDGDFDAGIIIHEYTHGTSNRLTGGPANVGCLSNSEQMGEGWSDYYGLMFTQQEGDTGPMRRGIGTYALNQPTDGVGIRPAPYSTDFSENDFTYQDTRTLAVPHGVGFVWATILWEVTWDLIDEYGYSSDFYDADGGSGNQAAIALVTEAMKLQACSPGFVDGRDAIFAADAALYPDAENPGRGLNYDLLWSAFARRGLGVSADQGSSSTNADNTEAFDTPVAPGVVEVTPDELTFNVTEGGSSEADVTISNTGNPGDGDVLFTATISRQDQPEDDDDLGSGGPDAFGYAWIDSDEEGGPEVEFQDISGTGDEVTFVQQGSFPAGDEGYADIELPFDFPFYGMDYSTVRVVANGFLTFSDFASNSFINTAIPSPGAPNNLIAPFWDDLDMSVTNGGTVYTGTLPDGRFVVQFDQVKRYFDSSSSLTFQAILGPEGDIEFQYGSMAASTLASATVGIENADGTVGLEVASNEPYITSDKAVLFFSPVIWATVSPNEGTIDEGESADVTVMVDATELPAGIYTAELLIETNDPDAQEVIVPITLTVEEDNVTSIVINGPKGFRFLGTPAEGLTVDDLAEQNLVRGVPGYYPAADPANLWTEYDATTDEWIESDGTGEVLELGKAFRWRFYDKNMGNPDISVSVELPFTLSTTLDTNEDPVTVELQTDGTRFNYLANPFGEDLELFGIEDWEGADNLSPSPVWTYDPVARMWTAAPNSIGPWEAFRVRAKGPRTIDRPRTLTIPASSAEPTFARRSDRAAAPGLSLTLSGTDADGVAIGDRAMTFAFRDEARAAFDASEDVEKFQTPATAYALIGARNGRAFVGHDARPFADAEIPLAVEARGTEAAFTLRWDGSALPAGLPVVLVDLATGAEVDVRARSSYSFEVAARAAHDEAPTAEVADGSAATDRFVLRIGTGLASAEAGVAEVALEAVAPNPSSGSARVSFAVPEAGAVRVAVYDVRGREVAVLVDGTMAAGRHEAVLSSGSLAAGVYVVRLEAGGQVLTRQAVVVR